MNIDPNIVLTTAIVASVISSFQFLATRYLGRILDYLERNTIPWKKHKGNRKDINKVEKAL